MPRTMPQSRVRLAGLALAAISLVLAVTLLVRAIVIHDGLAGARDAGGLTATLLAFLFFALAVIVLVFQPERRTLRSLQWTAHSSAVAIFIAFTGVWLLVGAEVHTEPGIGTEVTTGDEVDDVLGSAADAAYQVPTGVYVQSLEFLSANNVQLTGYVWQTWDASIPPEVTRGFVLPEAIEEAYESREAYREVNQDGSETIGWYFHAIVRQQFDYRQYPFDRQDVWLRLWHADLAGNVILTPDFAAYADIDPGALPGLMQDFVYEGWDPEFTGFSIADSGFNTSFGLDRPVIPETRPDLYYNVGLQRNFQGPLLDHLLALLVVALLLFATVRLTTMDEDHQRRRGNLVFDVLGFCAALMFIVILAHNGIRGSVSPDQIAYMEMFPFLLYISILLVAMNAILLTSSHPPRLISYRDNIVARLLYWPLLLGALLVITLFTLVW